MLQVVHTCHYTFISFHIYIILYGSFHTLIPQGLPQEQLTLPAQLTRLLLWMEVVMGGAWEVDHRDSVIHHVENQQEIVLGHRDS